MKSNACCPAASKYELEGLANKDFHYLTKSYLARKLKEKDCLISHKRTEETFLVTLTSRLNG